MSSDPLKTNYLFNYWFFLEVQHCAPVVEGEKSFVRDDYGFFISNPTVEVR